MKNFTYQSFFCLFSIFTCLGQSEKPFTPNTNYPSQKIYNCDLLNRYNQQFNYLTKSKEIYYNLCTPQQLSPKELQEFRDQILCQVKSQIFNKNANNNYLLSTFVCGNNPFLHVISHKNRVEAFYIQHNREGKNNTPDNYDVIVFSSKYPQKSQLCYGPYFNSLSLQGRVEMINNIIYLNSFYEAERQNGSFIASTEHFPVESTIGATAGTAIGAGIVRGASKIHSSFLPARLKIPLIVVSGLLGAVLSQKKAVNDLEHKKYN